MIKSKLRGWKIEFKNGVWIFCDSEEAVSDTWNERPCGHCGKSQTEDGHDGCLGALNNVINACCGHGEIDGAYIQFVNGLIVSGARALRIISELKKRGGE